MEFLANDHNTPAAFARLHEMAAEISASQRGEKADLENAFVASAQMLGLLEQTARMGAWSIAQELDEMALRNLAGRLAELRADAVKSKDFGQVDAMKAGLVEAGVEVRMGKDGVELIPGPSFDAAKLETLQ